MGSGSVPVQVDFKSSRWVRISKALAEHKLPEIERLIEQAQAVKRWLEAAKACHCPTFEDCTLF